jgi:hypothetical protein
VGFVCSYLARIVFLLPVQSGVRASWIWMAPYLITASRPVKTRSAASSRTQ